jgi:hypothetical protein
MMSTPIELMNTLASESLPPRTIGQKGLDMKNKQFKLFLLIIFCASCGGLFTPETVQTGIATAQGILTILNTVLKPAVETASALCTELTKEQSLVKEEARFECASITDAWANVSALSTQAQEALKTGDDEVIQKATKDLAKGADELQTVLSKSVVVRGVK